MVFQAFRGHGAVQPPRFENAHRLITNDNDIPPPTVYPFVSGKAKNALLYAGFVAGVLFVMTGRPLLALASPFALGFFGGTSTAAAASVSYNSQNMPLLSPAVNLDPNPAKGGGDIAIVDGAALQPQEGPSGTAADIEEWPASSQVSVYTVRSGDTLSQIASMFSVSVNTIIWSNDIKGGVIHPGDTLVILPITGIRHTIATGETLASLAKKFKADANDIAQYNGLDASAPLAVGTSIIIPNGEITSAPASAPSSHRAPKKAPNEPFLGGSGPAVVGYYAWPLNGGVITQGLHGWNAVDIGAPKGTGIYSSAPGIVIVARSGGWNGGYGSYVVIQHSNGTQTLYGHMSRVLVTAGDSVSQGQTIGLVGATGLATGPHLHFEVRGAQNPFASLGVGGSE